MPTDPLVPLPAAGRVFGRSRRVRLGDVSPAGRLRLDAMARYLQDVSNDDTRDAGMADEMTWVVRRTVIEVPAFPVLGEELDLRTFCSGTGPRWAERRVAAAGTQGSRVEAATLWVHVDDQGRPALLPPGFLGMYGEAAGGRTLRARLEHGPAPTALGGAGAAGDGGAGVAPGPQGAPAGSVLPWPLRFADFDVLGHMNNAAYWAAVEEVLSTRRHLRAPLRAELEFRSSVEVGAQVELRVVDHEDGGVAVWFTGGDTTYASAVVRPHG